MGTPLERLEGLSPEHLERLSQQWITTVEQLVGLAAQEPLRPLLAERLGVQYETLSAILRPFYVDQMLGAATGAPQKGNFGLGLWLAPATVRSLEAQDPYAHSTLSRAAPLEAGLPEMVNLAPRFAPVRDQGERGTCLSFSSCAAREFNAPERPDLSEQFFYWAMKQCDGDPWTSGSNIPSAIKALRTAGVCLEASWPYDPAPQEPDAGPDPPPEVIRESRRYCWERAGQVVCRVEPIKRILAGLEGSAPQPVVIGVMVFDSSFFSADVFRTGRITIPFRGEPCTGGHALCVVGYQDVPFTPGGGYLIIRNSWGTRWATHGEFGAGYGLMPYAYLSLYGVDALSLASARRIAAGEVEAEPPGEGRKAVETEEPARSEYVCAACGQAYASRFSLVRPCAVCGALICQSCVRLKDRDRCRAHQEA